jgi:hypothetical protein
MLLVFVGFSQRHEKFRHCCVAAQINGTAVDIPWEELVAGD